jgi:hypothetical protein
VYARNNRPRPISLVARFFMRGRMGGMRRIRFNLRTLLIAIALVALFFGYAQWRRQSLLREAKELEAMGFTLLWQDTWKDRIWPVVPKNAKFEYYSVPGDNLRIGSDVYPAADEEAINAHYARGTDRLNAMGVEEVRLDREGKPSHNYTGTKRGPH